MRARVATLAAIACLAGAPSLAGPVSDKADSTTLVIYGSGHVPSDELNDPDMTQYLRRMGLALVTETRTVDLPQGPSVVRFRGVADTMVPQTAEVQGLPGAGAAPRDFDYNLLSPGGLLAKSIGARVRLVRTNPKTGAQTEEMAIVRAASSGVVLDFGGRIEALHCSGLPERLIFDTVPAGLTDAATLSIEANAPRAGRYPIKLTYLASGMAWAADYVARIRPDGRTLDLTGWITLRNSTATSFVMAPTEMIGGRIAMTGEDEPIEAETAALSRGCWPTGPGKYRHSAYSASPVVARGGDTVQEVVVTGSRIPAGSLGDYKTYTLPEPATVAARQIKQVQFLDQPGVAFEHFYQTRVLVRDDGLSQEPDDIAPRSVIRLTNTAANGLGLPLPNGNLSVMAPDADGGVVLAGEGRVQQTPVGLPVELTLGRAEGLAVRETLLADRLTGWGKSRRRLDIQVEVDNDKPMATVMEIYHLFDIEDVSDVKVFNETERHVMDRGAPAWTLALKPGERRVLRYAVEFKPKPAPRP